LTYGELQIRYNKRGRVNEIFWEDIDFPYQIGVVYEMMPGGTLRPVGGDPAPPDTL
jgi:hypothetical protein